MQYSSNKMLCLCRPIYCSGAMMVFLLHYSITKTRFCLNHTFYSSLSYIIHTVDTCVLYKKSNLWFRQNQVVSFFEKVNIESLTYHLNFMLFTLAYTYKLVATEMYRTVLHSLKLFRWVEIQEMIIRNVCLLMWYLRLIKLDIGVVLVLI